ncbi:hypothetical protein QTH49_13215 [Clostridium perfringens]|nr:hypothetical protein [Clostridium perfringens]
MGKVLELNLYKSNLRKDNEKKAFETLGIIKVDDDLYLYPKYNFISKSELLINFLESSTIDIVELLDELVIEKINSIISYEDDNLSFMLLKIKKNVGIFEIFNLSNNMKLLIALPIDLNDNNTVEILTSLIAGAINKRGVKVTFFERVTYNTLIKLIL